MKDIGEEILDDLIGTIYEEQFWEWFDSGMMYTQHTGALTDEGDDWACNICDELVVDSFQNMEKQEAIEIIETHIFKEHAERLVREAIKEHLVPKKPDGPPDVMRKITWFDTMKVK